MPIATIDGLRVNYVVKGSGPPLLMLAPGGFDASMDKWATTGAWKNVLPMDSLSKGYTVIAYDRRESGESEGRVERLSWALFAEQGMALLEHLKIPSAVVFGGCMGCSVALAFAARYPEATRALILHWPVGGYLWKINGFERFRRHASFAREHGLDGVVQRAKEGPGSFWNDPEAGPWASCIARYPGFAASFEQMDLDVYLGWAAASGRALFDRDTPPGAEPEEIMGMKSPALVMSGDDPNHAASAAHYLRELLPNPEFWPVMPPNQTPELVLARLLEFRHSLG